MPFNLPPEIHNLFIHELAEDSSPEGFSALCACSLVSHSFCISAHKRLFSTIKLFIIKENSKIPPGEYGNYLNSTSRLFQESAAFPEIGLIYKIRSFCLVIEGWDHQLLEILNEGPLASMLDSLHGVRHGIQSFSLDLMPHPIQCHDLTPEFLSAFFALCRSPSLKKLRLRGFFGLPSDLIFNTQVRGVYFYKSSVSHSDESDELDTSSEPDIIHAESITADDSLAFIDLLHSRRSMEEAIRYREAFKRLTHLDLSSRKNYTFPRLAALALHAPETLQFLALSFQGGLGSTNPWLDTDPIELHRLENLHTLHVRNRMNNFDTKLFVVPLVHALERISTLPVSLKNLYLRARTSPGCPDPSSIEWTRLEKTLTAPPFKNVPQLTLSLAYCYYGITVAIDEDHTELHRRWESGAMDGLPTLTKIQSINCTCAFD